MFLSYILVSSLGHPAAGGRSCVSLLEEERRGCVEENGDCENRKLEGLRRPECVVDICRGAWRWAEFSFVLVDSQGSWMCPAGLKEDDLTLVSVSSLER